MVQMLLAEGMLLCSLFWAFCWLGTGSDEKNIRNFSTYPDEVQKIVKARPELSGNIRQRGPAAIFAGNLLLFTALLFCLPIFQSAYRIRKISRMPLCAYALPVHTEQLLILIPH